MTDLALACARLEQDAVRYVNILEILRRGSGTVLYAAEDGILLHDRGSGSHMMSATNGETADKLLALLPDGCELLTGHELFYFDRAAKQLGLTEHQICHSVRYSGTEIAMPQVEGAELCKLEKSDAPYILEHYSHSPGGVDYIEGAIERGMIGAFIEGVLAGFIGFHGEGTMGLLEVLPDYQRRGLGALLEAGIIRLALERGQYAFGHVIVGNQESLALQQKLGLEVSAGELFWLF